MNANEFINVDLIHPDKKDTMRAENLSFRKGTFYGSGAPFASEASGMAKRITDAVKLVRRAKAGENNLQRFERLEAALRASQNSIEFMSNLSKF